MELIFRPTQSWRCSNSSRPSEARCDERAAPDLLPGQHSSVTAFPTRHWPVSQLVQIPLSGPAKVAMHFPLHPDRGADIDDAAGLGHAFQVLRHWITDGATHPYDIHPILVFRQAATPLYDLV